MSENTTVRVRLTLIHIFHIGSYYLIYIIYLIYVLFFLKQLDTAVLSKTYSNRRKKRFVGDHSQLWINTHLGLDWAWPSAAEWCTVCGTVSCAYVHCNEKAPIVTVCVFNGNLTRVKHYSTEETAIGFDYTILVHRGSLCKILVSSWELLIMRKVKSDKVLIDQQSHQTQQIQYNRDKVVKILRLPCPFN